MESEDATVLSIASELTQCLSILYMPAPDSEALLRTTAACEQFYQHNLALPVAKTLLLWKDPPLGSVERLYALSILQNAVWKDSTAIRAALAPLLLSCLRPDETAIIQSDGSCAWPVIVEQRNVLLKAALVMAELILREFPQRWPDMVDNMLDAAQMSRLACQFVILTLAEVCEECVDKAFNSRISPQRRADVIQGLHATADKWCPQLMSYVLQAATHLNVTGPAGEKLGSENIVWYGNADVNNIPAAQVLYAGLKLFSSLCTFMPHSWLRESPLLPLLRAVWSSLTLPGRNATCESGLIMEMVLSISRLVESRVKATILEADEDIDVQLALIMLTMVRSSCSTFWQDNNIGLIKVDYENHMQPLIAELCRYVMHAPRVFCLPDVFPEASEVLLQLANHPSLIVLHNTIAALSNLLKTAEAMQGEWLRRSAASITQVCAAACVRPSIAYINKLNGVLSNNEASMPKMALPSKYPTLVLPLPASSGDGADPKDAAFDVDYPGCSNNEWEYGDTLAALRNSAAAIVKLLNSVAAGAVTEAFVGMLEVTAPTLFAATITSACDERLRRVDALSYIADKAFIRRDFTALDETSQRLQAVVAALSTSPVSGRFGLLEQIALLESLTPLVCMNLEGANIRQETPLLTACLQFSFSVCRNDGGVVSCDRMRTFASTRAAALVSLLCNVETDALLGLLPDLLDAVSDCISSAGLSAAGEVTLCDAIARVGCQLPDDAHAAKVFEMLMSQPLASLANGAADSAAAKVVCLMDDVDGSAASLPALESLLAAVSADLVGFRVFVNCIRAYQRRVHVMVPLLGDAPRTLASVVYQLLSRFDDVRWRRLLSASSFSLPIRYIFAIEDHVLRHLLAAAKADNVSGPEGVGTGVGTGVTSPMVSLQTWVGQPSADNISFVLQPVALRVNSLLSDVAEMLPTWRHNVIRCAFAGLVLLCGAQGAEGLPLLLELLQITKSILTTSCMSLADVLLLLRVAVIPCTPMLESLAEAGDDVARIIIECAMEAWRRAYLVRDPALPVGDVMRESIGLLPANWDVDPEVLDSVRAVIVRDLGRTTMSALVRLVDASDEMCDDCSMSATLDTESPSTYGSFRIRRMCLPEFQGCLRAVIADVENITDPSIFQSLSSVFNAVLNCVTELPADALTAFVATGDAYFQAAVQLLCTSKNKDTTTTQSLSSFATAWYKQVVALHRLSEGPILFFRSIPTLDVSLLDTLMAEATGSHQKFAKTFKKLLQQAAAVAAEVSLAAKQASFANAVSQPDRTVSDLPERLVVFKPEKKSLLDDHAQSVLGDLFGADL